MDYFCGRYKRIKKEVITNTDYPGQTPDTNPLNQKAEKLALAHTCMNYKRMLTELHEYHIKSIFQKLIGLLLFPCYMRFPENQICKM